MVPAPPEPAVNTADTFVPIQTAELLGVFDKEPEAGTALTFQLISTGVEVVQPDPSAIR